MKKPIALMHSVAVASLSLVLGSPSLQAQQWTDWEPFATGTFDAKYWYRSPIRDVNVSRRVQSSNPDREQYRLEGLFGGTEGSAPVDIVVDVNRAVAGPSQGDYSLWIDDQFVEAFDISGQRMEIRLCDGYTYYDNYFPSNPEYAMQYEDASYYREETGEFHIYSYYHYPDGTVPFLDSFYQDRAQGPETFIMKAPQFKDYTCTLEGLKVEKGEDGFPWLSCRVGLNDLSEVRLTAIAGKVDDIRSIADEMSRGQREYTSVMSDSDVRFRVEEVPGEFTLVYLTYKADGTPYQYASVGCTYEPDWHPLGQGMFTDGFISKFLEHDMTVNHGYTFGEADFTYPVEVQESLSQPGRYRIVNPYGATSPYFDLDFSVVTLDKRANHYMVFNATDPEKVSVEYSESGFHYGSEPVVLYSEAWDWLQEGYGASQVPETLWGKLYDGVIDFPDGTAEDWVLSARIMQSPASIYGRSLRLVLPDGSGLESIEAASEEGISEWFTLQGVAVKVPEAPGMYIHRAEGRTSKVMVR